ncbi:hypothetical protein V7200_03680 [Cytobacillus firmus]|uniref:Uncharacterized protein n=1 Tax=Cytobacillus firmus TaxID=1399 RepID=A0A800MUG4_CYTFI|nr:hypothetical protein [Cytobacillus firmus]KAF0822664.1 hypothetical protein KIS1582_3558 [Cytobacillus firmus]
MKSGKVEEYRQLSQFRDLKDFNNQFEQWMIDVKDKFTKGERIALKRLVRFSASIAGVCFAKIQTIVAATHQFDGVGISRSTFKRMLTKAKEVGLLVIHNTFRNGKQSHSVYVFNTYPSVCKETEPPNEEQLSQHNKSSNLSKSINIKLRKDKPIRYSNEFLKYCSYYFTDDQCSELNKIRLIHTHINKLPSESSIRASVYALKITVSKLKSGKVKRVMGYFDGVIRKIFKQRKVNRLFINVFDQ